MLRPARHLPNTARPPNRTARLAVMVGLVSTALLLPSGVAAAATTVPLGTAGNFAVLAGSGITNTGPTTITGDVGLHPGTAVTGFDSVTQDGTLHVADDVALKAKDDLTVGYTNAAGQTPVTTIPTELGTTTLTAGVYDSAAGTFGVTGPLTLDGEGDPDAVFIFQMDSTLTTASASSVELINGANVCNVFWQVGSSATLGADSVLRGTVMALESITLTTGAVVDGRVLARGGAVTMDTNTITNPSCAAATGDGGGTTDDTPTDTTPTDDTTPVDDTPTDDTTPVDDTPTDTTPVDDTIDEGTTGESTTGEDSPPTDDTTSQITDVPTGGVATGGGPAAPSGPAPSLLAGMFLLLAAAGSALGAARRRVRT